MLSSGDWPMAVQNSLCVHSRRPGRLERSCQLHSYGSGRTHLRAPCNFAPFHRPRLARSEHARDHCSHDVDPAAERRNRLQRIPPSIADACPHARKDQLRRGSVIALACGGGWAAAGARWGGRVATGRRRGAGSAGCVVRPAAHPTATAFARASQRLARRPTRGRVATVPSGAQLHTVAG